MFRMYKLLASRLMAMLLYTRVKGLTEGGVPYQWERGPGHVKDILYSKYVRNGNDPVFKQAMARMFDYQEEGDLDFKTDDVIREFVELVGQTIPPDHDRDLIDTIAGALQQARGQNAFSGKTLQSLRKAILTPDELIGLKSRLKKMELSCSNCGGPFQNGDMLTLVTSLDSGATGVWCTTCKVPYYIRCNKYSDCENHVSLDGKQRTTIGEWSARGCGKCDKVEKKKTLISVDELAALDRAIRDLSTAEVATPTPIEPASDSEYHVESLSGDEDDYDGDGDDEVYLPEEPSDEMVYEALDADAAVQAVPGEPAYFSSTPVTPGTEWINRVFANPTPEQEAENDRIRRVWRERASQYFGNPPEPSTSGDSNW